jgi:hypothetical protein
VFLPKNSLCSPMSNDVDKINDITLARQIHDRDMIQAWAAFPIHCRAKGIQHGTI